MRAAAPCPLAFHDYKDFWVAPTGRLGCGGRRPPFWALTSTGSTSLPSGMTERFILAMCCSVARAAWVFPVETLNRADSGINWAQTTRDTRVAVAADPRDTGLNGSTC